METKHFKLSLKKSTNTKGFLPHFKEVWETVVETPEGKSVVELRDSRYGRSVEHINWLRNHISSHYKNHSAEILKIEEKS